MRVGSVETPPNNETRKQCGGAEEKPERGHLDKVRNARSMEAFDFSPHQAGAGRCHVRHCHVAKSERAKQQNH